MHVGATQLFGRDHFAGRGPHQRRAADEDRSRSLDDDRLVGHRRNVCAAGRARTHDGGDLRDALSRHAGLVIEDAPEVVAIGEDVGLQRQKGAARVDEIDARQMVLRRDFLRAQMFFHRHRVVRSALDRRVVGHDRARRAGDRADARDDAGRRRVVTVHPVGGQRGEFEERRTGIDEALDALARGQLAALTVTLRRDGTAALAHAGQACLQVLDQGQQGGRVGRVARAHRSSEARTSCSGVRSTRMIPFVGASRSKITAITIASRTASVICTGMPWRFSRP